MVCTTLATIACVASVLASSTLVIVLGLPMWATFDSGTISTYTNESQTKIHVSLFAVCLEMTNNDTVGNPRYPNAVYTCAYFNVPSEYQLNCTNPRFGGPYVCSRVEEYVLEKSICDPNTKANGEQDTYNWNALVLNQPLSDSSIAAVGLTRFLKSACGKTGNVVQATSLATTIVSILMTIILLFEALCPPYDCLKHVVRIAIYVGFLTVILGTVFLISWGFEASHLLRFKFTEGSYLAFSSLVLQVGAVIATYFHASSVYERKRSVTKYKGEVYVDPATLMHVIVETSSTELIVEQDVELNVS